VLEQRRGLRAVDVDLREHREGDAVIELAELLDLLLAAWLLAAELVAREAEHLEALAVQLAVELLEALVLRREAALACRVDDQEHLALVARELDRLAVDVVDGDVVEARHGRCRGTKAAIMARTRGGAPETP
jgi:hypothetical protein